MSPINAIRTARVPQRLAGTTQLGRGLEQWLAACDPAHHGLPRDAVVLVRRLSTRWSTVICPDTSQRYAPLIAVMAGARRAATADANADVVWFANEAELLACMARDALAARLTERWWWRTLQQGLPARLAGQPALARWLQNPKHVPRALQWMGAATALTWLQSVGEAERAQVVAALAQVFCLAPETPAWVLDGRLPVGGSSTTDTLPNLRSRDLAAEPGNAARTPQSAKETEGAALRLLHLCAALTQDAAAASSPTRLRLLAAVSLRVPSPDAAPRPQAGAQPLVAETPRAAEADWPVQLAPALDLEGQGVAAEAVARVSTDAAQGVPSAKPVSKGPAQTRLTPPIAHAKRLSLARGASPPERDVEALAGSQPLTLLHTRHGGLLFLLNAALQLQLYGDFTQPRFQGLDCPPWRFLLLAGRAWCGPGFRRDPLHAWLLRRSAGAHQSVPLALWPQLHARLAQALDGGQAPRRALRQMLGLSARLQDTGERLDLFFSLTELPLVVRLSGLDRDPGWIPVAGCDVRFHFD